MSYVYLRSEPGLWTVGHYSPDGAWHSESDHDSREEAAARVARLNGADLLDALRAVLRDAEIDAGETDFALEALTAIRVAARAAIAKATGA